MALAKQQVAAMELLGHIKTVRTQIETLRKMARNFENSTVGSYRLRSGLLDAVDALDHAEEGLVEGYRLDP